MSCFAPTLLLPCHQCLTRRHILSHDWQVPEEAFDISFAFTDGHDAWDSNEGMNYSAPVWQPLRQRDAPPRSIASIEVRLGLVALAGLG